MLGQKTHFEMVPVEVAKRIAEQDSSHLASSFSCSICGTPVALERCKIDELGEAVHEKCYVVKLARSAKARTRSSSRA